MKKTVLITGISSGFGLAMAARLKKDGHTVYGTVRRDVEPLDGVHYLRADVRKEEEVREAVDELIRREGRLDVLINNAGMGIGGPVEFSNEEEINLQMDTNFMGQVRFIKAVLPIMRHQKGGRIICLSSIAGLFGIPYQGYYSASKFAIEGLCQSLRMEVRPHHIDVITIEPGDFCTGFTASRKKGAVTREAAEAYPSLQTAVNSFENDEKTGLKPSYLADKVAGIVTCRSPRCHYVISTLEQKLSLVVKALVPDKLFSRIISSYYN